jgi:4-hydroxybenzoate polyprenyltransferase
MHRIANVTRAVIFYLACLIVGLFCAIALGLGPLFFILAGVFLAITGFRERRRRWWGLAGVGAAIGLILAVAVGWGWKQVVISTIVGFLVLIVARTVGRAADRRGALGRR